jgi:CubicO group peptidase (beta-lactamase class C family)
MLYGQPDMAGWAADHPLDHNPGAYWEYLSATSNVLAAVAKAQFATDEEYWAYPRAALFGPMGLGSATLETDLAGTWVGSSYLWASVTDWARLGQLMLDDGQWDGEQLVAPGWLEVAATPAVADGEGRGYGAQTWIPADPVGGRCRDVEGIPEDTLTMQGHWGQVVAMVPSRNAVITRLGWTFDSSQFDNCQLISDVLATLR